MTPMEEHAAKRREAVLDVLRQHPQGVTVYAIAKALGVDVRMVNHDIRRLRRDGGTDNIPAIPNGHNEPWLYFLTNEARPNATWAQNRIGDMESRFKTQIGQAKTMVSVTNGRTVEGRKARKIERTLEYLMKELAELEADGVLSLAP